MSVTVHATVRVEIEFTEGSWGPDCDLAQVYKQAKEGAIQKLYSITGVHGKHFKVVSEPKVTAVLVPQENR